MHKLILICKIIVFGNASDTWSGMIVRIHTIHYAVRSYTHIILTLKLINYQDMKLVK